jgi:4'-phosphopantetheinyl transferase EntD
VIAEILPDWVAVGEAFGDLPDAPLLGPEAAAVARAVPSRQREFATGRTVARQALAALGVAPLPLARGPGGEPVWPPGVVGSITHCAGYRGAVVAPADRAASVGIDAEPDAPLPAGVLDLVSLPAERAALATLSGVAWDRLLFCAKEAVYKAWYPLAARWLGFEEAEVSIDGGTFTARILVPGPVGGFTGRWLARDGLILTTIVVTMA